jgi:bidirectional [NiFe] hydrogenase diaphorase subunit
MTRIQIDGIPLDAPDNWTILEAARFLGIEIPTLCYHEGLSPWGGCRLCIVEIGKAPNIKIVSSCTYPVTEGLIIRTATKKIINARKIILELLISQCPNSKVLQDMASKLSLQKVRFKPKWERCIFCGLCVRMCHEQMIASAIGFVNRGNKLKITTPFDKTSEVCRRCGGCMEICPVCTLRCEGLQKERVLCNSCNNNLQPTCLELFENYNCWMGLVHECGTCVRDKKEE